MSASYTIEEYQKNSDCDQKRNLNIRVYEITTKVFEKNSSHLVNELYSRGVTFSIKISKETTHLIIYSLDTLYKNETTRDNLLRHLQGSYSLVEVEDSEKLFIPSIRKIEQDGKLSILSYNNGSKEYFLTGILSEVSGNSKSIGRAFSNFAKDLIQADIFSIVLTQFATRDEASLRSNTWGIMFIARNPDKECVKKREKEFQRYVSNNTEKLSCQLQFLTKRELTRYKTNFRLFVPWIKHFGVLTDVVDLPRLLSSTMQGRRIIIPYPTTEEVEESVPIEAKTPQNMIPPTQTLTSNMSQSKAQRIKPYPSVKNKMKETPIISISKPSTSTEIMQKFMPSNIEDLSVPAPRTMNTVFDSEYLKVRINKIFKEFEFKETMIFEDNFDLVLRKGSYYVFVRFFQDILSQNHAYEIVETLSSIAGLRNQFLCIVVVDVIEENARKLLNEYNILHLTLTDVLVNDSLKAKLYGTIIA